MSLEIFNSINGKINFNFFTRVPQILQTETSECGLACLAMICGFYGFNTDLLNLRQRFGVPSKGATLANITSIANSLNLKSRALSLELSELNKLKTPCILHWDMNHFVILVSVKKKHAIINDPAIGKRKVSIQECSDHFTGVALELWPNNLFEKKTVKTKIKLLDLVSNVSGLKSALLKIFSLSLIIESINLLTPIATQLITDHVLPAKDKNLLLVICLGLMIFTFFRSFVSIIRAWVSLTISTYIDIQWKSSLFDHLLKLPLSFFEKRYLGDIQSRFSSLDSIRTTFTNNIVSGIIDGIMTIGLIAMMWIYGGWMLFVVIGFTACYALVRFISYPYFKMLSEELIVKGAKASSHFMETLYGVATVKALGIDKQRSSFWLNLNIDTANVNIKTTRFSMFFSGLNTFISMLDQVAILWIGATMVMANDITLGMYVAFNAYRGQFSQRASGLIDMVVQFRMLSLHNERISDIVYSDKEAELPERIRLKKSQPAALELKGVTYQHDEFSKPIFENYSLRINPGESVAITGVSGSGKTTLLKIMCGLLSPCKGKLVINGMEIDKIGLNNYRNNISCVLQEDKLFSGSISQNISGFDSSIDMELVIACAIYANIHNEIMIMPMGYESLIGELGTGLSGGQKQRLLIARALYRRPDIIFLDEATSHLDIENEAIINKSISELNITRVIVAHRPSTIESADRIIDICN